MCGSPSSGQDLTWRYNGALSGGSGSWDTFAPQWHDGNNYQVWNNLQPGLAVFGGFTGTVEAWEFPINATGGMRFDVPTNFGNQYTLAGPGSLRLGGTITTNNYATISAAVVGNAPITKAGSELLTLSANSNSRYYGPINATAGTLSLIGMNSDFRASPLYVSAGASMSLGASAGSSTTRMHTGDLNGSGSIGLNGWGLMIHAMNDTGTFSNLTGAQLASLHGIGVQSFASGLTPIAYVRGESTLRIAGTATSYAWMAEGKYVLDNSTAAVNRIDNSQTVYMLRGGHLALIGNPNTAVTEQLGRLQLSNGLAVVDVSTTGGQAAAFELTQVNRFSGTIDFRGNGGTTALGQAGANPRVLASSVAAGFLGPWATVNGARYASMGSNGIEALATSAFASGADELLTTSTGPIGTTSRRTLVIEPSTAAQSIELLNGASLLSQGILLAGAHDFSIRPATGVSPSSVVVSGNSSEMILNVQQPGTTLTVEPLLSTSLITKTGGGTLALGSGNVGSTAALLLHSGAVRASLSALPSGNITFVGGVLEIDGGGTLARNLPAGVNWGSGSGGFAARNGNAIVRISSGAALNWTSFTNGSSADEARLIFGSATANARVDFDNPLSLDGSYAGFDQRIVRVEDSLDPLAGRSDRVRFTQVVSGGPYKDLLKTGNGDLELAAANTFQGGTVVAAGNLLLSHSQALGSSDAPYASVGQQFGSASAGILIESAGIDIAREITVQAGSSGPALLGSRNSGASTFSGNIVLGNAIATTILDKTVHLTADAGGTVTFSGSIARHANWNGVASVAKVGAGTVVLAGNSAWQGPTTVNQGTLRITGKLTGSSLVTVNGGALLELASAVSNATTLVAGALNLAGNAQVNVSAGQKQVLRTGSVTVDTAAGARLDLADNTLLVDYTGPSELSNLRNLITAGYAAGAWNGSGINSSTAATHSTSHGIGYAEASKVLALSGTSTATWLGNTVDSTSVLARYTLLGDADLSDSVNFFDLTALAAAYGGPGDWSDGDADYNGTINFFDLTALAANYGTALPSDPVPGATPQFAADLAAAFASVPDPSGTCLLIPAATTALLKRRRKHSI